MNDSDWHEASKPAVVPEMPCHCGAPVVFGYDGDPTHHRGMCGHCDAVRCDAFPGECGYRLSEYPPTWGIADLVEVEE